MVLNSSRLSVTRVPVILAWWLAIATIGYHGLAAQTAQPIPRRFSDEITTLSEPGGFFDTDNLISNERTYLLALDKLRELSITGGVYLGVGPDQNFSYIAQLQPTRAYIIDIRRDNLLAHLLFKTLFAVSPTRVEYLARLFGRPPPDSMSAWESANIEQLADYIDRTSVNEAWIQEVRAEIAGELARYRIPLSTTDRTTITRFHRTFIKRGLSLRFHSLGRPPRPHYPTYRDLLLGTDGTGAPSSYLATNKAYGFVRSLQQRDLIIPVVGDLAGDHAIRAIGQAIAAQGEQVSAFYTSNVEFYLFQNGTVARYLDNLSHLPHTEESVIIRSVFGRSLRRLPTTSQLPSYSAPVVHSLKDLIEGFKTERYQGYWDLVRPE